MENRIGNSHGTEIPKRPRSLDLKSVYESSKGAEVRPSISLKRKHSFGDDGGAGGGDKRKKSRKAVSISSFSNKSVSKSNGSSKSIEEVYNGSLNPHSHDLKELKGGSSRRLADGSRGFSEISLILENAVVKIPRRKRGFIGRKKGDDSSQVVKVEAGLDDKVSICGEFDNVDGENKSKPIKAAKKVKTKKGFDELKENHNGKSDSARDLKEEEGRDSHSDVNNGDTSLKTSHAETVAENGDSSSRKPPKKRNRKRKDLVCEGQSVVKDAELSIGTSVKISDGLQDDDEENLEENAARMLSSRFDTICAGFSSNSKSSPLPSTNGLSFLPSPGQEFHTRGSSYVSGSESTSVDTTGRVLRPRKQHREKGSSRKRRHYYEILSGDLDAYWVLNRRIKVFWPLDKSWYYGLVGDYDKERKLHHIKYDDRDEEWINLQNERFKLLLLPSEVPGKTQRKRPVSREKQTDGQKGKMKVSKENRRDSSKDDENCSGNYMDSEPIISWLARSARRVKPSPLPAPKKPKPCRPSTSSVSPLLTEEDVHRRKCVDGVSPVSDKGKLSFNSEFSDNLAPSRRSKGSAVEGANHPKDRKVPVVYYRRRFRKKRNVLCDKYQRNHAFIPKSDTSADPLVSFGVWEEHDILAGRLDPDEAMERLNTVKEFLSIDRDVWVKLNIPWIGSRQFIFELSIPVRSVLNCFFDKEDIWLSHAVLLLQYGMLMAVWPRVHLEMLFVDNVVGLRFFLFEGCMKEAVAFAFLVLAVFDQSNVPEKQADLQFPVTSIRLRFSCVQDFGKQLVFAIYRFSEVESSKWAYLEHKLKNHCVITRQLPLSECTYNNIKALQSGTRLLLGPLSEDSMAMKVGQRRPRQSVTLMDVSRESTCANATDSCSNSDKNHRNFPPFALSFTAAPTFFLGLHLKLLMNRGMSHVNCHDHDLVEHPENSGSLLADDCSCMEDCSNKDLANSFANLKALPRSGDYDGCSSCPKSGSQTGGHIGGEIKPSPNNQDSLLCVESCSSMKATGNDAVISAQKWQCHQSELRQCDVFPSPSGAREKIDAGSHSSPSNFTVEISSCEQSGKNITKGSHVAQLSTDLTWNMNGGLIPSPNPTARRSTWHRNRSSSTSFGHLAHGWSDGRTDLLQNNFGNGPKRPRTQVSYAFPYGAFDYGSKNKTHQQKGLPHKRIRMASEKRLSDVSKGSVRNFEFLSCDANVLITLGDKGWRESGVQVVLELFDHNEWKLAVKHSGTTKYSYKAHQFLQPGSANRYTHAMMWKGGKDWILEFTDRSQWALFKEMHEECYNRNIRTASVKNIPIPGVHSVEDNDDHGIEVPFFRSSKYFRQVETDVEMALAPSRVLYDMDSDDERWILENGRCSEVDNCSSWEISEEFFEKIVTMFEKAAYSKKSDQFTSDEIGNLMAGLGPMEAIKIIFEYWQRKRQRKGMPLIRHLQPPLWEKYQQQVREWELAMAKNGSALPNGCHSKVAPLEKPPMFAFCMKPRGLEVPNKGSKQRSQKKISVSGQSNNLNGDHDGFHAYGRRLNGFAYADDKVVYPGYYEDFDDSTLPQISPRVFSSREAGSRGYFSMSSDMHDRNHLHEHYRSKSKKLGTFVSPADALYDPRMYGQRNGVHRWNRGFSDWSSQRQYQFDQFRRHGTEILDGSDLDEFRLRDASGAAQHALKFAKFKRERAQRLLYRADLLIHRAVVSLTTAEAIKASSEDLNGDG